MRGITFSQPMMVQWLRGNKSITRWLMNPQPDYISVVGFPCLNAKDNVHPPIEIKPRYRPGETVYIKETWADLRPYNGIAYKADVYKTGIITKWKSPQIMPAWASRSYALIVSVRPERIQEKNEWVWRYELKKVEYDEDTDLRGT